MLTRRTVLRAMGTAIALPWFESLVPAAQVMASAPAGPPLRMAFLYVPNGMNMSDWNPRGPDESDFELPSILQPVATHRQSMNVITGLSLNNAKALGDGGGDHAQRCIVLDRCPSQKNERFQYHERSIRRSDCG